MTTLDWPALAAEIKAAREKKGMERQLDLAIAAGVSESTIGKLEAGGGKYTEVPYTLEAVCRALGWTGSSGVDILHGGKPTLAPEDESPTSPSPHSDREAPAEDPSSGPGYLARDMPLRMRQELRQGRVVDSEIVDIDRPGSDSKFLLVWKTRADKEEVTAEELEEWTRIQRTLRGLPTQEETEG